MFPGYNRIFWEFAANSVYRQLDIPDTSLGVDMVDVKTSVPVHFLYEPPQKIRAVRSPIFDISGMSPDGAGPAVKPEDFPNTGYIGDYLESW